MKITFGVTIIKIEIKLAPCLFALAAILKILM